MVIGKLAGVISTRWQRMKGEMMEKVDHAQELRQMYGQEMPWVFLQKKKSGSLTPKQGVQIARGLIEYFARREERTNG